MIVPLLVATLAIADGPKFERVVIDADFPGAYQVEVVDVNGDGKPDIVVVGGATCAWYENPTWKKRIITGPRETPGIITSATFDLDRDGKAEVAIGYEFSMNKPQEGKLGLAMQGAGPDDPWTFRTIEDVPSIHRLRWGEFDGEPAFPELVVATLFGPAAKPPTYKDLAQVTLFAVADNFRTGVWVRVAAGSTLRRPVLHAIEVSSPTLVGLLKGQPSLKNSTILTADNEGVYELSASIRDDPPKITGWYRAALGIFGAPGDPPKRGCSEVHRGNLARRGPYIATIEPWHGTTVAVYHERERRQDGHMPRTVIDDTLDDGHALWVADIDGDGDDEILAGHRGEDRRVSLYDYDGQGWQRTVLDRDVAAQDLRGGDVDGDGVPDVVAVGGATKNVVLYRFLK